MNASAPTEPLVGQSMNTGDFSARAALILSGPDLHQRCFVEEERAQVLGRGEESQLRIEAQGLSRTHARFWLENGSLFVEDLGSTNGTLVSGEKLAPGRARELRRGDLVECGVVAILVRSVPKLDQQGVFAQRELLLRRLASSGVSRLVLGEAGVGKWTLARQSLDAVHAPAKLTVMHAADLTPSRITALDASSEDAVVIRRIDLLAPGLHRELTHRLGSMGVPFTLTCRVEPGAEAPAYLAAYEALGAVTVSLPPLRESPERLRGLVDELLGDASHQVGRRQPPEVAAEVFDRFAAHGWSGNVTELRAALVQALSDGGRDRLGVADFALRDAAGLSPTGIAERAQIVEAIARCGGNQSRAARMLGISRRTLVNRLDRYGIVRPRKSEG